MHTFEGKSCRIHHNSDMSGEIHICDKNSDKELVVEGQDILDFVADYIKTEKVYVLTYLQAGRVQHQTWLSFRLPRLGHI